MAKTKNESTKYIDADPVRGSAKYVLRDLAPRIVYSLEQTGIAFIKDTYSHLDGVIDEQAIRSSIVYLVGQESMSVAEYSASGASDYEQHEQAFAVFAEAAEAARIFVYRVTSPRTGVTGWRISSPALLLARHNYQG